MKEDTDVEQAGDGEKKLLRQDMRKQLKKLGGAIAELLDGLVIQDLTLKERVDMIVRLVSLYQRGVAIDDSLDANKPGVYESLSVEVMLDKIAGESQDFIVVDAEIVQYPMIETDNPNDSHEACERGA